MDSKKAIQFTKKINDVQSLMIAFATGERSIEQPQQYQSFYTDLKLDFEEIKFPNPNPHKSLEAFFKYCQLQGMDKWASRRAYVRELYADVLIDLKRAERNEAGPKNWNKANAVLDDDLTPVRTQWLKAKNFIYASTPDFENSVKESVNAVESTLKILLHEPKATLGQIIKKAHLDGDIERLISQAYGVASNKDFVRHGGTQHSTLTKSEADFFLEFSAVSIIYITTLLKKPPTPSRS